jgi:hypothetical protein
MPMNHDDPQDARAPWDPEVRRRTGPPFTREQLDESYRDPPPPAGYDHVNLASCPNRWTFHNVCVAFGEGFGKVGSIADMSAGDGRIPRSLAAYSGIEPLLGEYTDKYGYPYVGTLQETVPQLPVVDLYVCTNTVEHLNYPDTDLRLIRQHCRNLLLACPIDEQDAEGQHLWYFTRRGVEDMFEAAGFQRSAYCELDESPLWEHFKFGIWACR